jgi:hypothetical protein
MKKFLLFDTRCERSAMFLSRHRLAHGQALKLQVKNTQHGTCLYLVVSRNFAQFYSSPSETSGSIRHEEKMTDFINNKGTKDVSYAQSKA